jgi:hypothetical protein
LPQQTYYTRINPLLSDIAKLLTILARAGHHDPASRLAATQATAEVLPPLKFGVEDGLAYSASYSMMDHALERFAAAGPQIKKTILEACARCELCDGIVTAAEAELLRAVAYSMDIPLPPFLPASR